MVKHILFINFLQSVIWKIYIKTDNKIMSGNDLKIKFKNYSKILCFIAHEIKLVVITNILQENQIEFLGKGLLTGVRLISWTFWKNWV